MPLARRRRAFLRQRGPRVRVHRRHEAHLRSLPARSGHLTSSSFTFRQKAVEDNSQILQAAFSILPTVGRVGHGKAFDDVEVGIPFINQAAGQLHYSNVGNVTPASRT